MNVPYATSKFESASLYLGSKDGSGSRIQPLKFGKQHARSYLEYSARREFEAEGFQDKLILGSVTYRAPAVPEREVPVEEVKSKDTSVEYDETEDVVASFEGSGVDPPPLDIPANARAEGGAEIVVSAPAASTEAKVERYAARNQPTVTVGSVLDVKA